MSVIVKLRDASLEEWRRNGRENDLTRLLDEAAAYLEDLEAYLDDDILEELLPWYR